MQKEDIKSSTVQRIFAKILIFCIKLYKATFSLWLGGQCKFVPSCSQYAIDAIENFGPFKGFLMSIWRIIRCNPFAKGGYDYPEK